MKIAYSADGFPGTFAAVNGIADMDMSWPLLVWSAISVGRAELFHIIRYGEYSLFEIAYRAAMIYANIRETPAGRLGRSEAYDGLDPSEKGAISYFLGLTMTKAFAERSLGVPWLLHLDVYRQRLQPILAGRSRPDLVGQTANGDWVAIESQGRTNGFDGQALTRAKQQARMLASLGGQAPVLLIGMVTHFGDAQLQFTASDPPRHEDGERVHLPLSRSDLIEAYYRPFREFLAREAQARILERDGTRYRAATVSSVDVTVGLAIDTAETKTPSGEVFTRRPSDGERHYAGHDGVLVELGSMWSAENMGREPQARTRAR